MKWHPTLRPWLSDTPEETRYVGLVLNGSLENKVVTREREPFFVMVKEREGSDFDDWDAMYGNWPPWRLIEPRRAEIETYEYRSYRWGTEQMGVWQLCGTWPPPVNPTNEDSPGDQFIIRDVEMDGTHRWYTMRIEEDQWIVEVNDYYVQRGRAGGKAAAAERWVQENLRANPGASVMRVSSDGNEWAEFDVRDPALIRYTSADDANRGVEALRQMSAATAQAAASMTAMGQAIAACAMNITLNDEQRRTLDEVIFNRPFRSTQFGLSNSDVTPPSSFVSPDSMSMSFDLERTDVCWKNVTGVECGEPSDPESDNGLCSAHLEEVRSKVKMK